MLESQELNIFYYEAKLIVIVRTIIAVNYTALIVRRQCT